MSSDAIRGHQMPSDAIRCHQMPSDAIRCDQRQSEAIRGNQRPSDAVRGNHLREQVGGHAISGHEDAVLRKARVERIQQHGQDLRTGRGSNGCGEPRVTWHSVPIICNKSTSETIRCNQRGFQRGARRDQSHLELRRAISLGEINLTLSSGGQSR